LGEVLADAKVNGVIKILVGFRIPAATTRKAVPGEQGPKYEKGYRKMRGVVVLDKVMHFLDANYFAPVIECTIDEQNRVIKNMSMSEDQEISALIAVDSSSLSHSVACRKQKRIGSGLEDGAFQAVLGQAGVGSEVAMIKGLGRVIGRQCSFNAMSPWCGWLGNRHVDRKTMAAVVREAGHEFAQYVQETIMAHGGFCAMEVAIDTVADLGCRPHRVCAEFHIPCWDGYYFKAFPPPEIVQSLKRDRFDLEKLFWTIYEGVRCACREALSPRQVSLAAIGTDAARVCIAAVRNVVRRVRAGPVLLKGDPGEGPTTIAWAEDVDDQPDDGC
jgi:hypothetical protein